VPGVKGRSGGRNALPASARALRGTRGKRPSGREPRPDPGAPDRPGWLIGEAAEEWDRVVPQLERRGLLTRIDVATLTGYCLAWATLRATTEDIAVNGFTLAAVERVLDDGTRLYCRAGPNPAAVRREKALADVRAASAMFGLSPADRARVPAPDPGGGSDLLTGG